MKKSGGEKDKAIEGYGIWAEPIEGVHVFEIFKDVLACATLEAPRQRLKAVVANGPSPVILRQVDNLLLALYSSCAHKRCYECQSLGLPKAFPHNDEDYCYKVKSLCELKTLLMMNETPADLKEDWPRIKELLYKAQEIGMDIGLRVLETETKVLTKQKNELDKTVKNILPDAMRGAKILRSAKAGHEVTHGSRREKEKRWKGYQEFINSKHAEKPHLSLTACRILAAKHFGVDPKTIRNHTKKSW